MDEISTMTVPPTLPAKAQPRDSSQVTRQTVSIRTVSSPTTTPLSTEAGATVFVGLAAPGVDSPATCRRRIPEVQPVNGYGKQSTVKSAQNAQNQQQRYQQQGQQHLQQAAHVVKIKINTDGDKKDSKVISTVRLTLDENVPGHENSIACERSSNRDGGVLVSATNLVNEQRRGSAGAGDGDGCVKISVGSNPVEGINNNNNNKDNRNRNDDCSNKNMVHRETSDTLNTSSTNNRSNTCFYYNSYPSHLNSMVMSSGQCSPDTLDSGTCSDLDGTPPPLPKKKNASTVILASDQHNRTGSLTSSGAEVDSDDNESNISCDSLNAGELSDRITDDGVNGNGIDADQSSLDFQEHAEKYHLRNGVNHQKYRDTDDTVLNLNRLDLSNNRKELSSKESTVTATTPEVDSNSCSTRASPSVSPAPSGTSSLSKASTTPRIRSPIPTSEQNGRLSSPVVKECTYEERKQEQERLEQSVAGVVDSSINPVTGKKYLYEYDRFYKFHMNELKGNNKDTSRGMVLGDKDTDECFAGYKILDKEAIRSAKGTVRGVKNRVRAGIATFLQKPSSQAYIKKELGKVVVYTTTSGIVRKTFYNCKKVKQILRTHMVKYDELDLFGDVELQVELRDRLGSTTIQLPQLFIDGQHIGGFDTVERLNESGELRDMLKPYQSEDACTVCLFCGGYQWQLCPTCNGSKRSVHRNDFTAEFVALKCAKCDVNGLIRCPHC